MLWIGIDPGKQGAIAMIEGNQQQITGVTICDMPLLPNGEVNATQLHNILIRKNSVLSTTCYVEKAQPMPKQGVVSVFSYGCGYGTILAILHLLYIPLQEIPASKWKKSFSLSKDKTESVTKAIELFPSFVSERNFYTPKGRLLDGRAEALLIAEYCRRMSNGG